MEKNQWAIPSLETERLLLRQLSSKDIDDIFFLFSDPQVMKFEGEITMTDRKQAEQFIATFGNPFWYVAQHSVVWAFVEKETNRVIGTGGLRHWNGGPRAEIGLDVVQDCWSKGYGSEALHAMISFAFQTLKLHEVYAYIHTKNKAAFQLVKRAGFEYRGSVENYPLANQYVQALFFIKKNFP